MTGEQRQHLRLEIDTRRREIVNMTVVSPFRDRHKLKRCNAPNVDGKRCRRYALSGQPCCRTHIWRMKELVK